MDVVLVTLTLLRVSGCSYKSLITNHPKPEPTGWFSAIRSMPLMASFTFFVFHNFISDPIRNHPSQCSSEKYLCVVARVTFLLGDFFHEILQGEQRGFAESTNSFDEV